MYKPRVIEGHWITWPRNLVSRLVITSCPRTYYLPKYDSASCKACGREYEWNVTIDGIAEGHDRFCPVGVLWSFFSWAASVTSSLIDWYVDVEISWRQLKDFKSRGFLDGRKLAFPDGTVLRIIQSSNEYARERCKVVRVGSRTRLEDGDFGNTVIVYQD